MALLTLPLSGCVLVGVEPDEIDLADGTEMDQAGGTDEDDGASESTGDGDGDPGDGDGDVPPGDGDGDPTGDGDGDPGDGDGDADTGDGDGDSNPCEQDAVGSLVLGANAVEVLDAPMSLDGDCGAPGPEAIYTYTAAGAGDVQFTLTPLDFEGVVYLSDDSCTLYAELACESPQISMTDGQMIYVVVDSFDGAGLGTVEVTAI